MQNLLLFIMFSLILNSVKHNQKICKNHKKYTFKEKKSGIKRKKNQEDLRVDLGNN